MPHPVIDEPDWTLLATPVLSTSSESETRPVQYTRPLLGQEATHNAAQEYLDGLGEVCMGVTFETEISTDLLRDRVRKALAYLRFTAPIIACTIIGDAPDLSDRCWLYTVNSSEDALQSWIDESLTVRYGAFETDVFIAEMSAKRIPYLHSNGLKQHIHFYLLVGNDGLHGLFMHGTHAIMDARPTLRSLDLMLTCIAQTAPYAEGNLQWGSEWKNLPKGPIKATGGPRDDWDVTGGQLLQVISNCLATELPSLSLHPPRSNVAAVGNMLRLGRVLDKARSMRIIKTVKEQGFTMSQLADAALIMSILAANPTTTSGDHVTLDVTVLSQDRYLVSPSNSLSHFIAGLIVVPLKVTCEEIPTDASPRERLLSVMRILKAQYEVYLENPSLPHLLPTMAGTSQTDTLSSSCSIMTNLGPVEKFVSSKWADGEEKHPVITVKDMAFGHRLSWRRLMNHMWSMDSTIHLQVQASDVWDEEMLNVHLCEIEKQICLLSDDTADFFSSGENCAEYMANGGLHKTASQDLLSSSALSNPVQALPTEIPYPGYHFTNTIHHQPYPFIDPKQLNLAGKVVFITGASTGIGRATAIAFARSGASGIIIAARRTHLLDSLLVEMRGAAVTTRGTPPTLVKVEMDLLDKDSIDAAVLTTRAVFSKVDVLLNVAGAMDSPISLSQSSSEEWWRTMEVNVRGTWLVTQALLPLLMASNLTSRMIINVVSNIVHLPDPYCSAYHLSKLALMRISELLHEELREISVIAVHPGSVETAMTANIPENARHILIDSVDLSAHTFVWLASERRDWLSGRYVSVTWDMAELEGKRDEIVHNNKLKLSMVV